MVKATINTIYVIESLGDGDTQTGKELYDDTISRYAQLYQGDTPLVHHFFQVNGKTEFLGILEHIKNFASFNSSGVLIHIEAHGSKAGIHLADQSMIDWECLQDFLIEINISLNNQLFITMATCLGRYLHETIDISKRSPFCAFISASRVVFPDEITKYFTPFFDELIRTRDLIEAYKVLEPHDSLFYYKDVQVVFDELWFAWRFKMKNDPTFKEAFKKQVEKDFRDPNFAVPGTPKPDNLQNINREDLDFEEVYRWVEEDFEKQYRKNFLFGMGREIERPRNLINKKKS